MLPLLRKIRLQVHVQIMVVTLKSYLKDLTKCWKNRQYNGIIQSQDLHVNWENLMDYKKQVINQ